MAGGFSVGVSGIPQHCYESHEPTVSRKLKRIHQNSQGFTFGVWQRLCTENVGGGLSKTCNVQQLFVCQEIMLEQLGTELQIQMLVEGAIKVPI